MNWNRIVLLSTLSALVIACGGDSEVDSEAVTKTTKVATVAASVTTTQVATAAATVAATATAAATEVVEENLSEYTVVAGDNLTDIAARYGLTLAQLRALNPDVEGDVLWVGQVLKVTGDPPPATATAVATATTATAAATTVAATATPTPVVTVAATTTPVATVANVGSNPYSSLPAAGAGSGTPPFIPYGSNAGSGALVTASANGLLCGSVNADAAGQWFMRIEDSCTTAGELVNFSSDGKSGLGLYAVGASMNVDLN
jgi:LysM repeat protein